MSHWHRVKVMVLNTTFSISNTSAISWWSVLLPEYLRTRQPAASHGQTLSHKIVLNTPRHERDSYSQL
jgi:hypothetical protein